MTSINADNSNESQQQYEQVMNRAKYFLPLYLLVPVMFWLVFHYSGTAMEWKAFGLGALGWVIAFFLRGPLSAIVMKMPKEKATTIIVASSGVFEECVRIAVLLLTSLTFSWSLSIGQGWAAIEVLFVIINLIVMISLSKRTDEKSIQAKEMLQMQGNMNAHPVWGVIERIFASAFHIGCTLLVAKYPWLVVLLIPLHSFVNLSAIKLSKQSMVQTELLIAIFGIITLTVGILVFQ
ncbi:YhfC family glutamic-type intramembrane protease [Paenibacillus macquariensis]|uniref:Uncharacterized membrane protein YhfC n=1 Tax=Paenibacillus macquariensis TaxID=948756 RepID=A0ABY1KAH7_9BACL|nr:YhfC family glutamic-type intramembrane protease [Paenibacillus macquariensis]MEC0093689.1 YhfC family glutamic-type intramembrane protease [Paenibacillus macquariensis]OAB31640.1 hypothetical protein PMSM_19395 [Paenibacillus macquariensis subsp. macquariensis]SIR50848.1 Uncharacterized membrane protein YhfC [Paenibacillus macquariensis]